MLKGLLHTEYLNLFGVYKLEFRMCLYPFLIRKD